MKKSMIVAVAGLLLLGGCSDAQDASTPTATTPTAVATSSPSVTSTPEASTAVTSSQATVTAPATPAASASTSPARAKSTTKAEPKATPKTSSKPRAPKRLTDADCGAGMVAEGGRCVESPWVSGQREWMEMSPAEREAERAANERAAEYDEAMPAHDDWPTEWDYGDE